jgi:hypothetical protein
MLQPLISGGATVTFEPAILPNPTSIYDIQMAAFRQLYCLPQSKKSACVTVAALPMPTSRIV